MRIYRVSSDGKTLDIQFAITDQISYQYTRKLNTVGSFSVCLRSAYFQRIKQNDFIQIDEEFIGIIKKIELKEGTDNDALTVSGPCIKGLLAQRITLANDGTNDKLVGYDQRSGYTDAICNAYVRANAYMSTTAGRNFGFLGDTTTNNIGTANDKYYTRHEVLSDVISKLCARVSPQLGWDMKLYENYIRFKVYKGEDHSTAQNVNAIYKYALYNGTFVDTDYIDDETASKNTFYCMGTDHDTMAEAFTQTYHLGDTEKNGISRNEVALRISVDSDSTVADFKTTAQKEMENYRAKVSVEGTIPPNAAVSLGDMCTIVLPAAQLEINRQLTEVTVEGSASGIKRTAVFGDKYLTKFEQTERAIQMSGAISQPVIVITEATNLNNYDYPCIVTCARSSVSADMINGTGANGSMRLEVTKQAGGVIKQVYTAIGTGSIVSIKTRYRISGTWTKWG